MNEHNHDPLLKIRFVGKAVGPGKIPVEHLLRFLANFNKALQRSGMVLTGEGDSLRRGARDKSVKGTLALDLVLLTHGSPAAVLGFERSQMQQDLPGMDFGFVILEKALSGLQQVQRTENALPEGCDAGVLLAWRDAGMLFKQGIDAIQFTLNHRETPLVTTYTQEGFENLQRKIQAQGPQLNIRTIEGRLLMADFKEHGTRCRIHPSIGDPILCLFDEEQKDEVLEDMLHYVRIVGEALEDPTSGKITSIKLHDIERLEDREDEAAELLPQGVPIPQDFWRSPSLDELALAQNVQPMQDVESLFGTWPGDDDDGFEIAIDNLRHRELAEGGRP